MVETQQPAVILENFEESGGTLGIFILSDNVQQTQLRGLCGTAVAVADLVTLLHRENNHNRVKVRISWP